MWQFIKGLFGFASEETWHDLVEMSDGEADDLSSAAEGDGEGEGESDEEPGEAIVEDDGHEADLGLFLKGDHVQILGDLADELKAEGLPTTGTIIAIYHHLEPTSKINVTLDEEAHAVRLSTFDWKINGPTLRLTPKGVQQRRERAFAGRAATNEFRRLHGESEMVDSDQGWLAGVTQLLQAEAEGADTRQLAEALGNPAFNLPKGTYIEHPEEQLVTS